MSEDEPNSRESEDLEAQMPESESVETQALEAFESPAAETMESAEETPMLDVHAPHETVHTWKDFFIHIATIVVGLLIAVGLEQAVEYVHHRREVAETREALRREHDANVKLYAVKLEEFRRFTPILEADLAVFQYLQKHPGAPAKDWPGRLSWYNLTEVHVDSAWRTAQQNNVLTLMPPSEVQRDADLYRRLQLTSDLAAAVRSDVYEARRFTINDPDASHLTPLQVAREIDLTNKALLDYMLEGASQFNLHGRFSEFPAADSGELSKILGDPIAPADFQAVRVLIDKVRAIHDAEEADSPDGVGTK